MKNSIIAFRESVRPYVTPCRIPLVQNRGIARVIKNCLQKKSWLPNQISLTRSSDEVRDGTRHSGWPARATDFDQNTL